LKNPDHFPMTGLLLGLAALVSSDCFKLKNSIVDTDMNVVPSTCFEFHQPTFNNINLTVTLGADSANTFFGSNNGEKPLHITVIQEDVGAGADLEYASFRQPVPIFCSSELPDDYATEVTPPEDTETTDGYALKFSVARQPKSTYYADHYGTEGDCIVLVRYMPRFDGPDISSGTCVGLVLGLILSTALITFCIIFITPRIATKEEEEKDAEEKVDDGGAAAASE
jgi:hypothetical protein